MKNKFTLFLIVTLGFGMRIFCQNLTGWIILRKIQSPRPKPLTNVCAIRGDLSGILYNPSVLSTVTQKEIFTLSELGMIKDKFIGVIYAHPLSDFSLSIGIASYDVGKVTLYWLENGQEKERTVLAQRDLLAFVSYGRTIKDIFRIGLTLKIATTYLAETARAMAYACDFGIVYFLNSDLTVSIAGQNIGSSEKFLEKSEELPTSLFVGVGYMKNLNGDFYFALAGSMLNIIYEWKVIPEVGLEFGRKPFGVFLGYKFNTGENSFTTGLSIAIKNIELSYSYSPARWLNSTHRFSLAIKFSS